MAARKLDSNLTKRERAIELNAANKFCSWLGGRVPANTYVVPDKRIIVNRSDDVDLERAVMREVSKVIALHPKVLIGVRANSGAAQLPGRNGKDQHVSFYKIIRGPSMSITDYWCILTNGKFAAIECKRRDWHYTGTPRELLQQHFIDVVKRSGGVGGFVTSAMQALEILNAA